MKIHLLSGFLGSGKTTAIRQAAGILLQQGIKTGVISNDQGRHLVDGGLFTSLAIPNREVINGCFCCNYKELGNSISSLVAMHGTEIIFAESVGSCTDLVATVLKPLRQSRPDTPITISVFADVRLLQMLLYKGSTGFDETVRYIYLKQLEEAGTIVINKIDLVTGRQLLATRALLQKKYGHKHLLFQNSFNKENVQQWLNVIDADNSASALPSLQIDYDVYASGEAKLAWADRLVEIYSADNNAPQLAAALANKLYAAVCQQQYPIGHLKFFINNSLKISFTAAGETMVPLVAGEAPSASMIINMRVQTEPAYLTRLTDQVFTLFETEHNCRIVISSQSAFQPGYPKPTHRLV